jgi:hypothetical protein
VHEHSERLAAAAKDWRWRSKSREPAAHDYWYRRALSGVADGQRADPSITYGRKRAKITGADRINCAASRLHTRRLLSGNQRWFAIVLYKGIGARCLSVPMSELSSKMGVVAKPANVSNVAEGPVGTQ